MSTPKKKKRCSTTYINPKAKDIWVEIAGITNRKFTDALLHFGEIVLADLKQKSSEGDSQTRAKKLAG